MCVFVILLLCLFLTVFFVSVFSEWHLDYDPDKRSRMTIKVIAIKKTMRVQTSTFAEGDVKPLLWHDNVAAAVSDGSTRGGAI